MISKTLTLTSTLIGAACVTAALATYPLKSRQKVDLVFSGGYATDARDMGRPVVLVATALGVPTKVFRAAFTHVNPARDGRPEPAEVHQNKDALLIALSPYGVTNDRLDEVSDYYRYERRSGEIWKHRAASGYALIENGAVTKIVIANPGSGYSSVPTVTLPGMKSFSLKAEVRYGKNLAENGSISRVYLR